MLTSLSAEAVNALVDAALEAQPDLVPSGSPRVVRVRELDFARPTKFAPEHLRRVRRALDVFAHTVAQRLSGELRTGIEVEVTRTTQLAWARAHELATVNAVDAVLATPDGGRALLCIEPGFILGAIELLLGGSHPARVKPRRLTEIDWALAKLVLDRLVQSLSGAGQEEFDLPFALVGGDLHPETAAFAGASDPTFVATLEVRLDGVRYDVQLILPWATFEPVAARLDAAAGGAGVDGATAALVRAAMSDVDVPVRAEVAAIEMGLEQVLALRPGDTLTFDTPASAGVTIFADDVPVHVARPGRAGTKRAVQILWPAEVAE